MSDREYNGWPNYETWLANLWMDNDRGTVSYWAEQARECHAETTASPPFTHAKQAAFQLANRMKDAHSEACDEMLTQAHMDAGLFADLLRGALSEVRWLRIAQHWIAAYCEEQTNA